jgi:signal transduction histidine kinase
VASSILTLPIDHAGEQVGDLAIAKAPGEPLRAAERGLLEDLAAHAGMAFENARLSLDLEGRVEELAARTEEFRRSRERLVTVRDAQRRRLEQELRDGVGAEIARIRDQIGFDAERVTTHAQEVRASLEHLSERTDAALEDLRAVARGIFPPLLADEGLEFALSALARRSGPHVVLSVDGGGSGIRYDPAAEAAIYFCCVQALQNAERHAAGHAVGLTLRPRPDAVSFTVRDEGEGFDPQETRDGEGFQIMRDRIAALGGTLTIESAPGEGTTVTGTIPARVLEVVG